MVRIFFFWICLINQYIIQALFGVATTTPWGAIDGDATRQFVLIHYLKPYRYYYVGTRIAFRVQLLPLIAGTIPNNYTPLSGPWAF
jgi:hypothetical protein